MKKSPNPARPSRELNPQIFQSQKAILQRVIEFLNNNAKLVQ